MGFVTEKNALTGSRIGVSNHAYKRFLERWHIELYAASVIKKAFEKGKIIIPAEDKLQQWFEKGLVVKGWFTAIYKEYKGYVFIFQNARKRPVLITILKNPFFK